MLAACSRDVTTTHLGLQAGHRRVVRPLEFT